MVYNLDELGFQHDKMIYAHDFPGGERRIIQKADGSALHISERRSYFRRKRLHGRPSG